MESIKELIREANANKRKATQADTKRISDMANFSSSVFKEANKDFNSLNFDSSKGITQKYNNYLNEFIDKANAVKANLNFIDIDTEKKNEILKNISEETKALQQIVENARNNERFYKGFESQEHADTWIKTQEYLSKFDSTEDAIADLETKIASRSEEYNNKQKEDNKTAQQKYGGMYARAKAQSVVNTNDLWSSEETKAIKKEIDKMSMFLENLKAQKSRSDKISDVKNKYVLFKGDNKYSETAKKGAELVNPTLEELQKYEQVEKNAHSAFDVVAQDKLKAMGDVSIKNPVSFFLENKEKYADNVDVLEYYVHELNYNWASAMLRGYENSWAQLSDKEIEMYNYLLAERGRGQADEYLDALEPFLNERQAKEEQENYAEKYKQLTGWQKAGGNVKSVFTNAIDNLFAGAETLATLATGDYDGNNYYARKVAQNTQLRQLTAEDLTKNIDNPVFHDLVSMGYQGIMSGLDSLAGSVMFGGGGAGSTMYAISSGLGAMAQKAQELYARGIDQNKIAVGAVTSGLLEGLFEKVSLGYFFDNADFSTLGKFFKTALVQGGVEASEEFLTEVSNIAAESLIQGYNSSNWQQINELVMKGYTLEEAQNKVAVQNATDAFWAAYSGFVSGGGMSVSAGVPSYIANRASGNVTTDKKTPKNLSVTRDIYDFASTMPEYTTAYKLSQVASKGGNAYNMVSELAHLKKPLTEAQSEALKTRLTEDGYTPELASKIVESAVKVSNNISVMSEQKKAIQENAILTSAILEVVTEADAKTLGISEQFNKRNEETVFAREEVHKKTTENIVKTAENKGETITTEEASTKGRNTLKAPKNATVRKISDVVLSKANNPEITDEQIKKNEKVIMDIGKALGRKIIIEDESSATNDKDQKISVNGYFDEKTGEIHLSRNAKRPIEWILKHEITHSGERTKAYDNFVKKIVKTEVYAEWLRGRTGVDASVDVMEAMLGDEVRRNYAEKGIELGKKQGKITAARQEIIADFVGDMLFNSDTSNLENFLNQLDKPTRNKFIQLVLDVIDKIKNAFAKGDKKLLNDITTLERQFADMLKDAGKETEKKAINKNVKDNIDKNAKKEYNITRGENDGRQENTSGRNAGISGQTFTSADSRLEKKISSLDGRKNYRGIGSTLKNILIKKGATPVELKQINSAESFYDAIAKAKRNNSHGAFVTQYEVSDYQQDKLFLSEDNNVGVAVTSDGDIISVFKNPDYKGKKAVSSILLTALENGGVKLDNFDGNLSDMYWQHGFIPVARTTFVREFAPDDWNYERDGEPDIIFWMHNGDSTENVANKIGDYGEIPDLTKLPLMEYEKAAEYRDGVIKKRQQGNTKNSISSEKSKLHTYAIAETDSDGNKLSDAQREFFKDSVVKDADGNLLVMYHGTPNAGFTVFRSGSYFTQHKWYADVYQGQGASSLGYKKAANNPDTYSVYLNIKKPFDTRNKTERDIFYNEFYKQWGTGTELQGSGLPDWMDAQDLQEFLEEKGYDYDGLILDEGGVGGYGDEVKSRGLSYVTFSSEQVKGTDNKNPTSNPDFRYSLPETETKPFKEVVAEIGKGKLVSSEASNAYNNGYMPKSLWTKEMFVYAIHEINPKINVSEMPLEKLQTYLKKQGTFGTGKFSAKTDFYGLDESVVKNLTQLKVDNFITNTEDLTLEKQAVNPSNKASEYADRVDELGRQLRSQEITLDEYKKAVDDLYKEAGEKYGTIKSGEMVTGDEDFSRPVPKKVGKGMEVRRFVRTAKEATPSDIADILTPAQEAEVLKGQDSYVRTSNKENIKKALEDIANGANYGTWHAKINDGSLLTAKDVALGELLLEGAFEKKDAGMALKLIAELSEVGTRLGQAVQAFSLLKRMGGLGKLLYVQQAVKTLNKDLEQRINSKKFKEVKINEALAMQLAESKTEEDFAISYEAIMRDIASQVPSTFLDKWNAWRYMAMLANPVTMIRNLVGNAFFAPTVMTKNLLATTFESISKPEERSKTFKVPKEYKEFAKNDWAEVEKIITHGGKYNYSTEIDEYRTIFKSKVLEGIRKGYTGVLEGTDALFLKGYYRQALSGYLAANKADLNNLSKETLAKAREYAIVEAQKATYRDASKVASTLNQLSRGKWYSPIIEGILPFKKTPINILKRGVEYSPIGLVKTLGKGLIGVVTDKKMSATDFFDGLASGTTGTGLFVIGMFLKAAGLVTIGIDDEDEWWRKLNGEQDFAITVWGKSYTIDWMAPACMPVFMGAAVYDAFTQETNENPFNAVFNAGMGALDVIVDMSMLQGISNLLDSIKFTKSADGGVFQLAANAIMSYANQGLPTVAGKITNTIDDTRRTTYIDKTKGMEGLQSAYDNILKKFAPWERQAYVNAWGEEEKTGPVWQRILQNFVSPGYYSEIEANKVTEEISRLYKETKDKKILPEIPDKKVSFKGITKNLTGEEYYIYATTRGQKNADYLAEMVENEKFLQLTTEQQAKVIKNLYEFSNAYSKSLLDYTYDDIVAMDVVNVTEEEYNKLSKETKTALAKAFFLKSYGDETKLERNGGSVVDYYINQEIKASKTPQKEKKKQSVSEAIKNFS